MSQVLALRAWSDIRLSYKRRLCGHAGDAQNLRDRHRAAPDDGAQCPPVDQLHRDERDTFGLVDLVDGGDIRVGDGGRGARLAQETLAALGIGRQLRR